MSACITTAVAKMQHEEANLLVTWILVQFSATELQDLDVTSMHGSQLCQFCHGGIYQAISQTPFSIPILILNSFSNGEGGQVFPKSKKKHPTTFHVDLCAKTQDTQEKLGMVPAFRWSRILV